MNHDRDARLASLRTARAGLVDSLMRLEREREAIEASFREAEEYDERLATTLFRRELEVGLGEVTMLGSGELVEIRLIEAAVRTSDLRKLGERLLASITDLRRQVIAERTAARKQIFRHFSF
ncbi:YbaB/EbfC family nucleoid-associated protein [Actinocorallia libanotica]|uniref:YbaB/EbfC family nucleoid-associated protein n=1 Tax=Actinocorallia libanotica TaxID=46162 RepID=A0ABP4C6D5_9ACTN